MTDSPDGAPANGEYPGLESPRSVLPSWPASCWPSPSAWWDQHQEARDTNDRMQRVATEPGITLQVMENDLQQLEGTRSSGREELTAANQADRQGRLRGSRYDPATVKVHDPGLTGPTGKR